MELAALFWGGAFLTLLALSGFSVFWARLRCLRMHPEPLEGLETQPEPKILGDPLELKYNFTLPRIFLPALKFQLQIRWPFTFHRILNTQTPLFSGMNQGVLTWVGPRGQYSGEGAILSIRDFWGFFQGSLLWPTPAQGVVLPGLKSKLEVDPQPSGSGDRASRSLRRERNSELLESRKYYPGDDFRKINWKVFAHMGELFLRIGEENPPPEAQIGLVLDLGASGLNLVPGLEEEFMDHRVDHLGAAAQTLEDRGYGVLIFLPGQTQALNWIRNPGETALVLAGARAEIGEPSPIPPPSPLTSLVLFTHPLSPTRELLKAQLEREGIKVLEQLLPWPWADPEPWPWFTSKPRELRRREKSLKAFHGAYLKKEAKE